MVVLHPFQRRRYTFQTVLSPEECNRRILAAMNDYNGAARGRFLMATAFGERFTARIEPGSLGSSSSGSFMKHFVVEATGTFPAARNGRVDVTIGFQWATSLIQIAWRLLIVVLIAAALWTLTSSPVVPIISVAFGIFILPLFLLWSLIALVQGLVQAGKDWSALQRVVQGALGGHLIS